MPLMDTSIPLRVEQARIQDPVSAMRNIQDIRAREQEAALAPVRAQQMQQQVGLNDLRLQEGALQLEGARLDMDEKAKDREERDALGALYREHKGNMDEVYKAATSNPKIRPETALGIQQKAMEYRKSVLTLSREESAEQERKHEAAGQAIAAIRSAPTEKRSEILLSELQRGIREKWLTDEDVETYKGLDVNDDKQLEGIELGLRGASAVLKENNARIAEENTRATAAAKRREDDRVEFAKKYTDAVAAGDIYDQASHEAFLADETPASIKSEIGRLKDFTKVKDGKFDAIKRLARTAAQQNAIDNPTRDNSLSLEEIALQAAGGDAAKALELLKQQKAAGAGGSANSEAQERLRQKDLQDRYDKEQQRVDAFDVKKDALLKENDEITARLANGVFVFDKDGEVDSGKTQAEVNRLKAKVTANKAEHARLVQEQKTINDRKEKIFPKGSAPTAPKMVATQAQLQAYATAKGISVAQAKKEFEDDGVEVK